MKKLPVKNIVTYILIATFCYYVIAKLRTIESKVTVTAGSKGFVASNLISQFPYDPKWDVPVSPEVMTFVRVITQQPYRWLSKGLQAYAFESQDGLYVLKFIQQQRLQNSSFKTHPFHYLFNKDFRNEMAEKQRHRQEIFSSTKFVFEEIPNEAGFIYVHLNRTEGLFNSMKLVDVRGETHKVRPDETSFIIQRKATYLQPTITAHVAKNDIAGAHARIDQIFALLLTLAKKDIADGDYALIRNNNIGFLKDKAIYIDTGHIYKKKISNLRGHMEYEYCTRLQPLHDWLTVTHPELGEYFAAKRAEILASLPSEALEPIP